MGPVVQALEGVGENERGPDVSAEQGLVLEQRAVCEEELVGRVSREEKELLECSFTAGSAEPSLSQIVSGKGRVWSRSLRQRPTLKAVTEATIFPTS